MASKKPTNRPEHKTWVWHIQFQCPAFILDTIKIVDKPVVAIPFLEFDTDNIGIIEDTSRMVSIVTEWKHLLKLEVNPRELDY